GLRLRRPDAKSGFAVRVARAEHLSKDVRRHSLGKRRTQEKVPCKRFCCRSEFIPTKKQVGINSDLPGRVGFQSRFNPTEKLQSGSSASRSRRRGSPATCTRSAGPSQLNASCSDLASNTFCSAVSRCGSG